MTFRTIQQQAIDRITEGHVMSELTPEKRVELRAKAEAATPGVRTWSDHIAPYISISANVGSSRVIRISEPFYRDGRGEAVNEAEFMAAFDRETCLALLDAADERDQLRAEVEFLKEKGITVGMMKTSDRPKPYLAYDIRSGSELDDTHTINRIAELEARVASLQRSLSDVCRDWSDDDDDLHARCDAILGPEIVPPGECRTPVAGDDGRVAAAFRKLKQEKF